jgi:hypothetical protein
VEHVVAPGCTRGRAPYRHQVVGRSNCKSRWAAPVRSAPMSSNRSSGCVQLHCNSASLHDRQLCLDREVSANHQQLVGDGSSKSELWIFWFDVFSVQFMQELGIFILTLSSRLTSAKCMRCSRNHSNIGHCLHSTLKLLYVLMILKWVFKWSDLRDLFSSEQQFQCHSFLIKKVSDCFRFHYIRISMLGKQPSIQRQCVF